MNTHSRAALVSRTSTSTPPNLPSETLRRPAPTHMVMAKDALRGVMGRCRLKPMHQIW